MIAGKTRVFRRRRIPDPALFFSLISFSLFFFFPARCLALFPELHAILAYESSSVAGVFPEISIYAGDPERCRDRRKDSICGGAYDEDIDRDPRFTPSPSALLGLFNWGSHFWQPSAGPAGGLLKDVEGFPVNLDSQNAYQRAAALYEDAKSLYHHDPPSAYYMLGKVVHLLTDMATPAHVHLDPHISGESVTGDDSFEEYTASLYVSDDGIAGRLLFQSHFPVSNVVPVDYKSLPDAGYPEEPLLFRLFYSMANLSSTFDSDDANGKGDNGSRRGFSVPVSGNGLEAVYAVKAGYEDKPIPKGYRTSPARKRFILLDSAIRSLKNEDPPCDAVRLVFSDGSETHALSEFDRTDMGDSDMTYIAGVLMPSALRHVSALYRLFWEETHPLLGDDFPVISLNLGARNLHVKRPAPLELPIDIGPAGWLDKEAEVYAWLDALIEDEKVRLYFDGRWASFDAFSELRPAGGPLRVPEVNGLVWKILDDTSSLPALDFTIHLCLDRNPDGRYTPGESVCNGTFITVE